MAENKTHAESNVWMCILPIQQNGTDPSKVRMAGLRLYSEIIENFRNFEKFLISLLSVKNDTYRQILSEFACYSAEISQFAILKL